MGGGQDTERKHRSKGRALMMKQGIHAGFRKRVQRRNEAFRRNAKEVSQRQTSVTLPVVKRHALQKQGKGGGVTDRYQRKSGSAYQHSGT